MERLGLNYDILTGPSEKSYIEVDINGANNVGFRDSLFFEVRAEPYYRLAAVKKFLNNANHDKLTQPEFE